MDLGYLQRRLDGRVKEGASAHKKAIEAMMAKMAHAGSLGSGRTLVLFEEISIDEIKKWFATASQFVFSATDSNGNDVAAELEAKVVELHNQMLEHLRQRQYNAGMNPELVRKQIEEIQAKLTECCHQLMDDFRHGISGSEKLKKDPLVSLVANQTNSPGAIQQIGSGTFSQSAMVQNNGPLIQAINAALNSPEFKALPEDERDAISDIADALKIEAAKATPDEGKLRRWGKRMVEMTEKVGMQVASSTIAQVLVKIFAG